MPSNAEAVRQALSHAESIAVLTGAGISAESGIPTFRGAGGYWNHLRFEDLASPQGFAANPKLVWTWYEERRRDIAKAKPNAGHLALVELERRTKAFTLITQNVDGLHERAGSQNVLRLHGSIWTIRCEKCGAERTDLSELTELPPVCVNCQGRERPGVVWFGEMLPEQVLSAAGKAARTCDLLLVVGTAAQVYPAAGMIDIALEHHAVVVEINPDATPYSDEVTYTLRGPAGELLPNLL